MKAHEYQAKELLARFGVPVPRGRVAATAEEAKAIATELVFRHEQVVEAEDLPPVGLVEGTSSLGGLRDPRPELSYDGFVAGSLDRIVGHPTPEPEEDRCRVSEDLGSCVTLGALPHLDTGGVGPDGP